MIPHTASAQTLCVVRSGGTLYALPAVAVREVLDWHAPALVPLAPRQVAGILIYQGDVLTVVRLGSLLGQHDPSAEAAIVVLEQPGSAETFALAVESVDQVVTIPGAEIEPLPPTVSPTSKAMLLGLCRCSGELLLLLNLSSLTPDSSLQAFGPPRGTENKGEACAH